MKKVVLITLGCKVNQYESAAFLTGFQDAGYTVSPSGKNADIVVINSCTVTAKASAQSRHAIRQALRNNPEARVLITGCYTEIGVKEITAIEELEGRDYSIIGNSTKDQLLPTALSTEEPLKTMQLGSIMDASEICRLPVRNFGDRTRAYLRIQDGCESFCTYCIVPYTRGPSRSVPVAEVLEQAKVFEKEGYKELVLTGIHIGYYGKDLDEKVDITELVDRLTLATPEVRYRISSLEPTEITDRLLTLIQTRDNLMPHLHIPLQSGDDTILKLMNRKYSTSEFRNVITRCKNTIPEMSIGIDILAGFPGETEDFFSNTYAFLESLPFTYLHVFPYSRRPGTVAATFDDNVSKHDKDERVAKLRQLSQLKQKTFYSAHLNSVRPALLEGRRDEQGMLKGFTDNYIPIRIHGDDSMKKSIVQVMLQQLDGAQVTGEALKNHES